jgi:polyphosphate kinase
MSPTEYKFFDRDLSWLMFNDRVMDEAARPGVPLLERIRFLSIYSSNLDEFYRVRVPVIRALNALSAKKRLTGSVKDALPDNYDQIEKMVRKQQQKFGAIMMDGLLPLLRDEKIHLIYGSSPPSAIKPELAGYFHSHILGYLRPVFFQTGKEKLFVENNQLYFLIVLDRGNSVEELVILPIPTNHLARFFSIFNDDKQYIVFVDDMIRWHLESLFPGYRLAGCYSFKVTRDAELDLQQDYGDDIAALIEKQLTKRDKGKASWLLYEPSTPASYLTMAASWLDLSFEGMVEGGRYHNLRDLFALPVNNKTLAYEKWPAISGQFVSGTESIFDSIAQKDILINAPYHSYDAVLRFFNEAATHPDVTEICTSIYRVASDSRIAAALVTAALNGKKVRLLIELKARFDELNNLKWAKQLKQAGATIIYSSKTIKVHAKVALVKKKTANKTDYYGLLATGNFNEGTAAFYTDYILMTALRPLLKELEELFKRMESKEKHKKKNKFPFKHLLVAQYNLKERFLALIDREISHARAGLPAGIIIKVNNLEERDLIAKLYEASCAGVKISLIVRSVCCIVPGVGGMSENISVVRIVDRFLEHSRVFIFDNHQNPEVFLGSSDWMNRNIYHRIEVCFPVTDQDIRSLIMEITAIQLADNCQAVTIDGQLNNIPKSIEGARRRSQKEIYELLSGKG